MTTLNTFTVCTGLCLKAREVAPKKYLTLQSSDDLQGVSLWVSSSVYFVAVVKQPPNLTLAGNYFCFMVVKFCLIITLPYQKQALVMQTTNTSVCNSSDCVKKRMKRDKLGREMMLLKYEVYPMWLSSLPCPPRAPLGTSPTGKGSFPMPGRNFGRWELGPEG